MHFKTNSQTFLDRLTEQERYLLNLFRMSVSPYREMVTLIAEQAAKESAPAADNVLVLATYR